MKQIFRFFTLLLLAAVTSSTAWAVDVPKPKAMPLTVGAEVYILHVGTGKYVGQGESWSTQSCVTDLGLKYIVKNAKDDGSAIRTDDDGNDITVLPEGQYWLYSPDINIDNRHTIDRWNDGTTGEGIKCCFSDQTDWDERGIWQVTEVAENTYMFTVPEGLTTFLDQQNEYVEGEAWGVQLDHASNSAVDGVTYGLYHDVVYADAPEMCQFQFVAAADMAVYQAKVKLGELVDAALELDIDVMAYEAIIDNLDATVEEVNAAIEEITQKLMEADSWNYPTDITEGIITNPNPYEGSSAGWIVLNNEGKEVTSWDGGDSVEKFTVDGKEVRIGEFWNCSGYTIKQTIHVPKGVYTLRLEALTRTGMTAVFKVGDNQTFVKTYGSGEVNNRTGANKLFDAGKGLNDISWVQLEDADLEVSLTSDATTGDHWLPWRRFMLLDRGFNMRSFQNAAASLAEGWEDEFMKDDEENPGEKVWRSPFTQSYYDAVATEVEAIPTSTNTDEAYQIYIGVQKALNDLRENVDLYSFFYKRTTEGQAQYENPWDDDLFGGDPDFDDVWNEAADIFANKDFTKDNAYLADLKERYLTARQNAIYNKIEAAEEGQSVKGYITNPAFKTEDGTQSSFDGWTVNSTKGFENNAGSISVIEQYNGSAGDGATIDVHQEIAIRKVGAYMLKTKGWYRSTTDKNKHDNDEPYNSIQTWLYGASSEYEFNDIFSHGYTPEEKQQYFPKGNLYGFGENLVDDNGNPVEMRTLAGPGAEESDEDYIQKMLDLGFETVYPMNCTGANELFNNPKVDWYDMTCKFLGLGLDSPVEIGVRGRNVPAGAWLIWDDFDLIYLGSTLDVMQPIAVDAVNKAKAEFFDATGLVNQMSKTAENNLTAVFDAVEKAADVNALAAAYKKIDGARTKARESIAAYAKLQAALEKLDNELVDNGDTASEEAIANAEDLWSELSEAYAKGTIADEDVPAAIDRINKAIKALYMPGNMNEASDDNEVDCTKLIANPKYLDDDNKASTEGWTATNVGVEVEGEGMLGYAEGWGSSAEGATFDINQTIVGMPEGTYKVMVNGLFRQGGVDADVKMSQYGYAEALGKLDLLDEKAKEDVQEYNGAGQFYANGTYKPLHRWIFIGTDEWTEAADVDFRTSANEKDYEYKDSLTVEGEDPAYYYFPDNRAGLYGRQVSGYYENELYCYVDASGELTIGACNQNATAYDWTPFSNWRLYFLGTESSHEATTGIRDMENKLTNVEAVYSIDGRLSNGLQKGLNIVKTRTADGKMVVKKVLVK